MPLTDTFTAYLRGRAGRDDMADALAGSGHRLEAELLVRGNSDRRWVGLALPTAAEPGDVWLDTVELMPMVLYARDSGEPFGWLALRPVERWQFGAFLNVAPWSGSTRRIGDVKPMDARRLLAGDEHAPITHVLRDEASVYAMWFGKSIPHRVDWQLAAEALGPGELDRMWGPVREWADAEYDGAYRVVDAELIDFDPDDDDPTSLVLHWTEAPADVGFPRSSARSPGSTRRRSRPRRSD